MTAPVETCTAIRCRRCRGWLIAERSQQRQLGPVCMRHERSEATAAATALPLFELEVP